MFALDIIMNFRTTYLNRMTGEEIVEVKEIQLNYFKGQFFIDLLSSIPFDLVFSGLFTSSEEESSISLQSMSMLKIIRVLRLSRLINFMTAS